MPDLAWNKTHWGSDYKWPALGEEWSAAWGGSEPQWFGSLLPRLHRFLPARRILEIAPGFGRWTKFLIPACDEFVGIDLAEKCINTCRERFSSAKNAKFFANDGYSLTAAKDGSFDLIFSFDSLVHAEYDVLASYIPQTVRKLSPGGVALLHHSNLFSYSKSSGVEHGRAKTVSADVVSDLIKRGGGTVLIQEVINWGGGDRLIDCLTLFTRHDTRPFAKAVRLQNPYFMKEATLIQHFQSHYSILPDEERTHETEANACFREKKPQVNALFSPQKC